MLPTSAGWVMSSAHHLTKANIWPKFHENLSKGSGDMEWTRKRRMTFNCDLDLESALLSLVLHIISLRRTFDPNLTRQSEWQWSGFKIQGPNWWPLILTLTLSQHSWVMGSAHYLTEANIWPFKENPSRVKEKWSQHQIQGSNSWPSIVTLIFKSAGLSYGFWHCQLRWTFDQSFREYPPRGKGDTQRTQNSRLKPVTLNCDLVSAWLSYGFCTSFHWGKHLTKIKRKSFQR